MKGGSERTYPDFQFLDRRCNSGWIILEVLVALVLLGVILGPLLSGFAVAVDRARTARFSAGLEGADLRRGETSTASDLGEAWTWGARILSAEWFPGPELRIRAAGDGSVSIIVGVWIDGWFQGDESPDGSGETVFKARDLGASFGQELVLRARCEGGCWGPPWRSVVPDSYASAQQMTQAVETALAPEEDDTEAYTVAHVPLRANPAVWISDAANPVKVDGLGFPLFFAPAACAGFTASIGGGVQSWTTEAGRALDVYF
jgi:hypothetical protein